MTSIYQHGCYAVTLTFDDKLMGGIPQNTEVIEGWIRSKAGVTGEQEINGMMARTLYELGVELSDAPTHQEMIEASKKIAGGKSAVGFKQDDNGLYVESRQVKALVKEVVNILFSGTEGWSNPRAKKKKDSDEALYKKSPRNFTAERVFVRPLRISLGVPEPTGVELIIGHVTGPQGPRATLTYHQFVTQATITFGIKAVDDSIPASAWPELWELAQDIGLGAVRSQSYGTFTANFSKISLNEFNDRFGNQSAHPNVPEAFIREEEPVTA